MRFPARRNLEPGNVISSSAARKRAGIVLIKLGSGVALEGGRLGETGRPPAAPAGGSRRMAGAANQEWARAEQVKATISMKKQGLIGDSGDLSQIICY
jgi:hypothetical protein